MICNCCRTSFFTKDPGAFLCGACLRYAPDAELAAYNDAVAAIHKQRAMLRRETGEFPKVGDVDEELIEQAVGLWRQINAVARANREGAAA